MSTTQEKLQAIKHAVEQAKRIVNKLETIKSVSKLHKTQEYELEMAKDCVERGEKILFENQMKPKSDKKVE
jgi:isopropylmalate/homocitrate/citramalate synthase